MRKYEPNERDAKEQSEPEQSPYEPPVVEHLGAGESPAVIAAGSSPPPMQ